MNTSQLKLTLNRTPYGQGLKFCGTLVVQPTKTFSQIVYRSVHGLWTRVIFVADRTERVFVHSIDTTPEPVSVVQPDPILPMIC